MFTLALVVGSGLGVLHLPALPPIWLRLTVLFIAVSMLKVHRVRPLGFALLYALWVVCVVDHQLGRTLPNGPPQNVVCVGEVVGLPAERAGFSRFGFRVNECASHGDTVAPGARVRVGWYRPDQALRPGEIWQFALRLKAPSGRLNPRGFDYQTWLFLRGFGATASVRAEPPPQRQRQAGRSLDLLRAELRSQLRNLTPGLQHAGLIEALVIGSRDRIPPGQRDLLSDTGTGHLVAISGLHIGMVAGAGFLLASCLWGVAARLGLTCGVSRRVFSATSALVFASAYAALAGFATPTVRALIMLASALWVTLSRGSHSTGFAFRAALVIILLCSPLSLLDAGFWLSFCAVAVIVLGLRARRHMRPLQQSLWVNAVISLVLMPLTVSVFGEVHWLSPFANVVLVPVFAVLVVPGVLLATLVMIVWSDGAAWLFTQIDAVLGAMLFLLQGAVASLPLGLPTVVETEALVVLALASAVLLMPRMWKFAPVVVLAAALAAFSISSARPEYGQLKFTVLDVGHGLAVVLSTATKTLVYDTGPRRGSFDAGAQLVVPTVRSDGSNHIDALIVSHADNDHAGGIQGVLDTMPVARVLRPEDGSCRAGVAWYWDGVRFELLHPDSTDRGSENDMSCVLRVTVAGGQSLLLLGDLERRGERALLRRGLAPATVITVPHHGSSTSSSEALLRALQPALAINSHAAFGRFSLPHHTVAARYKALSIPLVSTAFHGGITLQLPLRSDPLQAVESARTERRRAWRLDARPDR